MITYWDALDALKSPVRQIGAKVELYNGSTLVNTFNSNDRLISFTIERIGDESKFFGFGVCQKLNVKLIDTSRELNITTANSFKIFYTINGEEIEDDYKNLYPVFNVTEVHRDENTNELSITAYDALYKANTLTFADLGLVVGTEYKLNVLLMACNLALGFKSFALNVGSHYALTVSYLSGGNFSGTETLKEVLDAAAEVLQCIYYVGDGGITFIPVKADAVTMATITKDDYITLESADNRRLTRVTHTTELGDNLTVTTGETGSTQYLRDNPLLNSREDVNLFLDEAIARVGGLTVNQFNCEWRGNFFLSIGDKIEIITKDNSTVSSYLVNDVISYDGTLTENTQWHYEDNETETEASPTSIGGAIKQTYARVDKVNRTIDLLASNISSNSEKIAAMQLNEDAINLSVTNIQKATEEAIEGINEDVTELTNKVNATMTSTEVKLEIQEEIAKGVDKVTTATGFTFNEEGLTVSKTDSEMSTTITEDGMQVFKNDEAVLTANNIGVDAVNLHATTYLIIGSNSRFEDFGDSRTGCFWIGG